MGHTDCALDRPENVMTIDSPGKRPLAAADATRRLSNHVEPRGPVAIARHYMRDLVYGANDGIITTFAVVAGVAGGSLSRTAVLVVGAANLVADGLSMGVGNYLAIKADESARAAENLPEQEASPIRHGLATFLAFVAAGTLPLLPYVFGFPSAGHAEWAGVLTLTALFCVGALRTTVTTGTWWRVGLEVTALGALVGGAAYAAGALAAWALNR
jgi:VIT1/CCC1 family predicted Fe2+/Mn2+ transporter